VEERKSTRGRQLPKREWITSEIISEKDAPPAKERGERGPSEGGRSYEELFLTRREKRAAGVPRRGLLRRVLKRGGGTSPRDWELLPFRDLSTTN